MLASGIFSTITRQEALKEAVKKFLTAKLPCRDKETLEIEPLCGFKGPMGSCTLV